MLTRDLCLELHQLLLLIELELIRLSGNQGCHATQALSQICDLQSKLLELCLLDHHLNLRLVLELSITGLSIKEERPGFLPWADRVWRALVERLYVVENVMEADLTEELVPDANDARPQLLLEPLLVLWAGRQPNLIAVGKVLILRGESVLALFSSAVAVEVS